jgi:AraC-like DNA-binding protein
MSHSLQKAGAWAQVRIAFSGSRWPTVVRCITKIAGYAILANPPPRKRRIRLVRPPKTLKLLLQKRLNECDKTEYKKRKKCTMKFTNIPETIIKYIVTRDLEELSQLTRYKIADAFGIHKSYLSEKFKQGTHKTILEFIDFEKMKRAEKLLKARVDLSVKDISKMIGIVKCEQFRDKFEKVYGMKPGKYRRLFRE